MGLILYFLRHGETTASQTGGYCGTLDPDLTPEGYQMAEDFADTYKFLPWVASLFQSTAPCRSHGQTLCRRQGYDRNSKKG